MKKSLSVVMSSTVLVTGMGLSPLLEKSSATTIIDGEAHSDISGNFYKGKEIKMVSDVEAFEDGEVYGIRSKDEFLKFAKIINDMDLGEYTIDVMLERFDSKKIMMNVLNAKKLTVVLLNDIDLGGEEVSIQPFNYRLMLTFDGLGNTVSNYIINNSNIKGHENQKSGLFKCITLSTIKNTNFSGGKIYTSEENGYLGSLLVGRAEYSNIINCHILSGEIMAKYMSGSISNALICSNIIGCSSNANITMESRIENIGGLVGSSYGSIISDSYFTGKTKRSNKDYERHLAGIVGYTNGGIINNCFSTENFTSGITNSDSVISGSYYDLFINNCYWLKGTDRGFYIPLSEGYIEGNETEVSSDILVDFNKHRPIGRFIKYYRGDLFIMDDGRENITPSERRNNWGSLGKIYISNIGSKILGENVENGFNSKDMIDNLNKNSFSINKIKPVTTVTFKDGKNKKDLQFIMVGIPDELKDSYQTVLDELKDIQISWTKGANGHPVFGRSDRSGGGGGTYIPPTNPNNPTDPDEPRISGDDRIETSTNVSGSKFSSSDYVVLASSKNTIDALPSAPLAASTMLQSSLQSRILCLKKF